MLDSIGIYQSVRKLDETNPSLSFNLIKSVFKAQSYSFFSDKPLKKFESQIQPKLTYHEVQHANITQLQIMHFQIERNHYYVSRIDDDNHIAVLVSQRKLDAIEAYYLTLNTSHTYLRPEKIKFTLQHIVDNPLGYTGKDCYIQSIHQELEETKRIIVKDVELLLERGERLQRLEDKTIQLQQASIEFENEAKKMNSCCGRW